MQPTELDSSEDFALSIGAERIAKECFDGQVSTRQVYRLHEAGGWPIFDFRGKLAARPAAIRAEIQRREQAALGKAA